MSVRRSVLAALLALPLALAGCKVDTINNFPSHPAHLRAANFALEVPTVNGRVNDEVLFPGVAFEGVTPYVDIDNRRSTLAFRLPGAETDLSQGEYDIAGRATYTMISFGTASSPSFLLLPDSDASGDNGKFQLRVANVAATRAAVDVYLTGPAETIDDRSPSFSAIGYGSASSYLSFDAGTQRLRVTANGTKTVLFDSGSRAFAGGVNTDLVVYAKGSGTQLAVALLPVNADLGNPVVPSTLATVRMFNAAPQTTPAALNVDGTPVATGIAYPAASSYTAVAAGSHTLAFEATATPGATVASTTATLAGARDYSVVLTGLPGANGALVLQDENVPSTAARVRFVNVSVDAPSLNVTLGDTAQVSALARNTASGYVRNAGGTYTLVVTNAATGAQLLRIENVALTTGQTTTVYIVGFSAGLAAVFVQDL